MALSDPDHVRQYVAKELNRVYGFDIPEDVVKGVMKEIFPRFRKPNDFMGTYFLATVKLLEELKTLGIPLHHDGKLIISPSKPATSLKEGDFFYQCGVSSPGTISVKYQYTEKLNLTTMKDEYLHRLLDKSLYDAMCEEAKLPGNIFLRLVVIGENGIYFIAVSDLESLVPPKVSAIFGFH
jgi:hypothetical protein